MRYLVARGFTLAETVVVIAVVSILSLLLAALVFAFDGAYRFQQASVDTTSSASLLMRRSAEVILPAINVLPSRSFGGTLHISGATAVVLKLPSIDVNGVALTGVYDYAVVYLSGGSVYRIVEADPTSARLPQTHLLSEVVDSLSITYDTADITEARLITIDLTTSVTVRDSVASAHVTQSLPLRNYQP